MMYKPPHPNTILLLNTLLLATSMILTSSNWLLMWSGFELNMIAIMPLMLSSPNNLELNSTVKYFIIQTLGSILFLMSIMMSMSSLHLMILAHNLMLTATLTKMGGAPCHFWLPQTMNDLPWLLNLLLMTWQKIAPFLLITHLTPLWSSPPLILITILNSMFGSLGGMNQTQMRMILAYSTIAHTGWMFGALLLSSSLSKTYFSLYLIIVVPLLYTLFSMNKTSSFKFNSPMNQTLLFSFFHLLSMGGLPPLLGFLPKWAVMTMLVPALPSLTLFLICGALMSLTYYLSIFSSTFLNKLKMFSLEPSSTPNIINSFSLILPLPSFIFILF